MLGGSVYLTFKHLLKTKRLDSLTWPVSKVSRLRQCNVGEKLRIRSFFCIFFVRTRTNAMTLTRNMKLTGPLKSSFDSSPKDELTLSGHAVKKKKWLALKSMFKLNVVGCIEYNKLQWNKNYSYVHRYGTYLMHSWGLNDPNQFKQNVFHSLFLFTELKLQQRTVGSSKYEENFCQRKCNMEMMFVVYVSTVCDFPPVTFCIHFVERPC